MDFAYIQWISWILIFSRTTFGVSCLLQHLFPDLVSLFVIRPTNYSRHLIITNKGLLQSVNELITFLIVFDMFEFCSANLTVNGSVD